MWAAHKQPIHTGMGGVPGHEVILTTCHYLSLQEAQRELLMPSSTEFYTWFLDGPSSVWAPKPKAPGGSEHSHSKETTTTIPRDSPDVLHKLLMLPLPSRLQRIRNCLHKAQLSQYTWRAQVFPFTYLTGALLGPQEFTGLPLPNAKGKAELFPRSKAWSCL